MFISKKLQVLSAVLLTGLLQGCSMHTQETYNAEYSLPQNLMEDYAIVSYHDVGDAEDGTLATYDRTESTIFDVLSFATLLTSSDLSDVAESASVIQAMKPSKPKHRHKHPLLFASIPYASGGDRQSAIDDYINIVKDALMRTVGSDGSVSSLPVSALGYMSYTGFQFTSTKLGCSASDNCILRLALTIPYAGDSTIAGEWVDKNDFEALATKLDRKLVRIEGADYYSAIELISIETLSQALFITSSKSFDYERAYQELSSNLPGTFYIYLPPETDYGITTAYPYMLNKGDRVLFETP